MTVFHSGHLFHLPKLSGQPYRGQKPSSPSTFFRRYFPETFPTTFVSGNIFRHRPHHQERKEEICNFSQSTEAKKPPTRLPHATLLRRPESHAPSREGTWPTFWCRASTSRLVRHCLALLSLHQSSSNLASPFFGISASAGLLSASDGLRRQLPSLAETCVCLGKASSSSPVTFLLCLGPDIPGSSSTAVIQSQVKWIWRLKILFLHLSSLDLLLSHRKN